MEQRLPGGNIGGAVLVDGTVRRPTGPWTPAVHALLNHLEAVGFPGAPRVLGFDDRGREALTFLPGATVGDTEPWPAWVHTDEALVQVGGWLRSYHRAVVGFAPPPDAVWRSAGPRGSAGDVVGHNDAAPYNAVWQPDEGPGRLVGFVDWDFAAPCSRLWDLAFVAFSWVPLYARPVAARLGWGDPAGRPRRLRLLLGAYGFVGPVAEVLDAVRERVAAHADGIRSLAAAGDPAFRRLLDDGVVDDLDLALDELERDRAGLQAVAPSGG